LCFFEVRYEDLREPATLRGILSFTGVDRTDSECSSIIENYTIGKLRRHVAASPWPLSSEPPAFYRRGEVDSWRRELTPGATAIIEAKLCKLMTAYGYEIQERRTVEQRLSVRFAQSSDHMRKFIRRRIQALI